MALGERGSLSSRNGAPWALSAAIALGLACLTAGTSATFARAEGCPNEQLRAREGAALRLPDCRAYEQVSPVAKNFTDALGETEVVQSSPSGNGVTFFSHAPFPGVLSATGPSVYLSTRSGGDWFTQGLVPSTAPRSLPTHGSAFVPSLTEDLSAAIVDTEPGLEPSLTPGRYSYLRDNATGALRLLGPGVARFADATADDSRIVFESARQLLTNAAPGVVNLYEWNAGKPPGQELSLVGVLPHGEAPSGGSVAGPGGSALGEEVVGGAMGRFYTQDTISADGSRVFFSDQETGQIYMREPEAGKTISVSAGTQPAYWRAATTDGSMVFYTEGENLYRFDVNRFEESKQPEAEALAEAREPLTSGAAGVLGTLGVSTENGSYVYFVATAVLAGNESTNKETAEVGKRNLYEWHNGDTGFIAKLSIKEYDSYDWQDFYIANPGAPAHGAKSSRVTPNGTTVLFTSQAQLTGYPNAGFDELYLYEAANGKLTCVSCNPSDDASTSSAYLTGSPLSLDGEPRNAFLTRNLSDDGNRVFFQTKEALVPQDTNEQEDVYEWEREGAGGAGGCSRSSASFSERSGGCLYLLSTGESSDESYFGDASTDGSNVFFFTRQPLVSQDQDENDDLYDARVEGGIAAQNLPPPARCTGEGCLGPVDPSTVLDASASATFSGTGNLKPPRTKPKKVVAKCSKGKKRSHGRCLRKGKKRSKKARRHA